MLTGKYLTHSLYTFIQQKYLQRRHDRREHYLLLNVSLLTFIHIYHFNYFSHRYLWAFLQTLLELSPSILLSNLIVAVSYPASSSPFVCISQNHIVYKVQLPFQHPVSFPRLHQAGHFHSCCFSMNLAKDHYHLLKTIRKSFFGLSIIFAYTNLTIVKNSLTFEEHKEATAALTRDSTRLVIPVLPPSFFLKQRVKTPPAQTFKKYMKLLMCTVCFQPI